MSFYTGTQTELLYQLPAAVTKNTYTTEAPISVPTSSTLPHCIVPANFFGSVPNGIGRVLYLHAEGTIANTSAATFQGRLGWDTTQGTIANPVTYWPTLAPTASTTCLWDLDVWYTCQQAGSAGVTLQVNGKFSQSVVATGTLSTAPQTVKFQTSLTSINAEVASYVELFGTWSASSASNTTTLQQMVLTGWN
jgi:hypothetical protein